MRRQRRTFVEYLTTKGFKSMSPQAIAPILFLLLGEPTMAQPPAFDAPYNFNDDAVVQPAKLQTTVMQIEATLDATLYNLALIQRDDGALANGIVTTDSLSPAVLTEFANAAQAVYASNLAVISAQQATNTGNIGTLTTQQGVNTSAISGLDTRVGALETSQAAQDVQIAINKANGDQVPALSQSNSDVLAYLATNTDYNPSGLSAFRFDPADYSDGQFVVFDNSTQTFEPLPLSVFSFDPADFSDGDIASFNSSTGNFEKSDILQKEISLTVSNATAVPGSVYNTIKDAYEYADSVLQAGGKLNIFIPASTTVTETASLAVDTDRMNMSITSDGSSVTRGTISNAGFTLSFSGNGHVHLQKIIITGNSTVEFSRGTSFIDAVQITNTLTTHLGGGALLISDDHDMRTSTTSMQLFAPNYVFESSGSNFKGRITANVTANSPPSAIYGVSLVNGSKAIFDVVTVNFTGTLGGSGRLAVYASTTTTATVLSAFFDGNETAQYTPAADTYGNHYSRIITTP